MSTLSEFISRVSDPFRGTATPNVAHVHGGGYESSNPTIAKWLEDNPQVSNALAEVSSAVAALDGLHEGSLSAFDKARERFDEAKAAEAVLHHDARALGQTADPEKAKRAHAARKSAMASSDAAAARASVASNNFAHTREALNGAVKYVGGLAAERRAVVVADAVALPDGALADIIKAQRQTIADLDIAKLNIESAPPPLEDAIMMVRASLTGPAPTIELGPRRVSWSAPKTLLNAAPRFGEAPVDIDDSVALLAWLFPDEMAARLEAAVRARYIGVEQTYTPAQRVKALSEVVSRRNAAEAIEVAAIKKAWTEGQYIPLRASTTPAVLLGIAKVGEAAQDPEGFKGSAYLGETAR